MSARDNWHNELCYDTIPFGFVLGLGSSSIASSKSFADGTEADVAAPAAARPCCTGATSLESRYQSLTHSFANDVEHAPFDLKPCYTRLGTDISHEALEHDLLRRCLLHLFVVILRILIVSHPYKLLVII